MILNLILLLCLKASFNATKQWRNVSLVLIDVCFSWLRVIERKGMNKNTAKTVYGSDRTFGIRKNVWFLNYWKEEHSFKFEWMFYFL